jgi:hypothetical protein
MLANTLAMSRFRGGVTKINLATFLHQYILRTVSSPAASILRLISMVKLYERVYKERM